MATPRHPLLRPAALPGWTACGLTIALVSATIVLERGTGRHWTAPAGVGHYAYLLLAPPFALAGALVSGLRPGHKIGALMAVLGVVIAGDEFTGTYLFRYRHTGSLWWPLGWLANWLWAVPIVLLIVGVLYFPTGRLPGPRWRWAARFTVAWGAGLILLAALGAGVFTGPPRFPEASLAGPASHALMFDWYLVFPLLLPVGTAAVVVRYRRADDAERAGLKWMCAAAVLNALVWMLPPVHVVDSWPRAFADLTLWLLPVAVTIAVLRHRLYEIDRIIGRALVYGALSAAVGAAYAVALSVSAAVAESKSSLTAVIVASVTVATLFAPARDRLQRAVDRLLYGRRREPREVVSGLGRRLEAALPQEQVFTAIVDTVASALRLPYVAIELLHGDEYEPVCARGEPTGEVARFGLVYRGDVLGRLVLSPRAPGEPFAAAELELMRDLARHAGVAVHAVHLTFELQRSRERLVAAREEERLRLRRDLHDGLGPLLAGIALRLDAATAALPPSSANGALPSGPADAADQRIRAGSTDNQRPLKADRAGTAFEQLRQARADLGGAVAEVRRLVDGLRPPELDVRGLAEAVRAYARQLRDLEQLAVEVIVPDPLPDLPAAVEVAAYRIAIEAVTNVVRHADATRCTVSITAGPSGLELEIVDNGRGIVPDTRQGFGLRSMQERADELGGRCLITSPPGGGTRISVRLPLPALLPGGFRR